MPVTLEAYRYGGGLGFRATEKWNTDNSTVLTSEGKTRADADATDARWVIIEGESSVPQGRSGILFLSHPENRSHPEPMRMWPPGTERRDWQCLFRVLPHPAPGVGPGTRERVHPEIPHGGF